MADSMPLDERRGPLAAFGYHNYRYLWISGLGVAIAFWMELVVIGWLVLELTGSPTLVGLVGACRYSGMALGPLFGALADRFDRRRIIIASRAMAIVYVLALAVLYYTSLLEVWHIFVLVIFGSIMLGFNWTTTSVLTADIVEKNSLASAVGMLMVGMSITSIAGPLMGGYLYEYFGVGGCFIVMASAYLFSCLLIIPMRLVTKEIPAYRESIWESMAGSIRYLIDNRVLSALMLYAAIANLFIFPCMMDLMPVFARDVLHVGASGLGWLVATQGVGRLIGALTLSTLSEFRYKGWLLIIFMIAWPALMGVFAGSSVFYISLILIAIAGVGQGVAMALVQFFLLLWSSEEFRGRVMGIRMFVVIFEMIGSIVAGALANLWGIATVVMVDAVSCIFASIFVAFWAPELRHRR